jgi:peroxiredoxin
MRKSNKFIFFLLSMLLCDLPVIAQFRSEGPTSMQEGQLAPMFEVVDDAGKKLLLKNLIKKGPVLLLFYRGEWCPYCNRQLSNLQDSLQLFIKKGAYVIAVTPESKQGIANTKEKTKASFSIVQDEGYKIMKLYHAAFKVDSGTVERYKGWGIDLEAANGNKDFVLPVPAAYVIGNDGKIKFAFFDEDYRKRPTLKQILKYL